MGERFDMINLWPFDPKEYVQLLWIKSPYRDRKREWMVPLFLQGGGGQTKEFQIPWGLLPNFRLGQYYVNGIPVESYKNGNVMRFDIEDPNRGSICTVDDLPKGLTNKKYSDIKDECLWKCDTGKTTLYIPCIEVVRSLLAPNSTLAHAILELEGINLIASCRTYVSTMDLIINQAVPRGLITEEFILHLAWLNTDPLAKKIWNSVLQGIRPRGDVQPPLGLFEGIISDEDIKPKKLRAMLPLSGQSIVEVRGIKKGQNVLVFEIISAGKLSLRFNDITYIQNPKAQRRSPDDTRPIFKHIRRKKEIRSVSVTDNPSRISKTMISKNSSNILLFENLPQIRKRMIISEEKKDGVRKKRHKVNAMGEDNDVRKNREGLAKSENQSSDNIQAEIRLFSGAEVLYEGNPEVHPIEFRAPSVLDITPGYGLKPFLDAINKLDILDQSLKILECKVDLLPAGRSFSHNDDGGSRKYAFITVKCDHGKRYIVEVERLKKKYLSSLIIEPKNEQEIDEPGIYEILGKILVGLVNKGGRWNASQLENHPKVRIHHVKHLDKWSALDWAIVIYNRLGIPVEEI
ncbi:MAG: hypothetical protein CVU90_02690 [Firmicutes bacterium HGW-Firmicutes-15]|nr:MAG: hypothetical protein CVU90_02690 [Firmicutes bacterium HGW-Firmicutes-15]